MTSRPTPVTLSSERLMQLSPQLEGLVSRVVLAAEYLRLLDRAGQGSAALEGLAILLDDVAGELDALRDGLLPERREP